MDTRYARNQIYINAKDQSRLRSTRLLIAGSGLGSNIAECALRLGFERITLIDGDEVEESNLNRQNYVSADAGRAKAEALCERLLAINPKAKLRALSSYIDEINVRRLISGHDIAINALDFTSTIPLRFDRLCREKGVPVLHPYNLGHAGLVFVADPGMPGLESLGPAEELNELKVVEYVLTYQRFWQKPLEWLEETVRRYRENAEGSAPPQLAIGSWLVAGMCTELLYRIATGQAVRSFPEFYLTEM